jgi:O-antigen/teichoic acid export membrane protein
VSGENASRSRRLVQTVASGFVARISGIALQVVSLPVAAVSLGNAGFTIYAMTTAIMSWLSLSQLGIGPALTVRIANFRGEGRIDDVKAIFVTGFWTVFSIAALVSVLALAIFKSTAALDHLFSGFADQRDEIRFSMIFVLAAFFLTMNLSSVEAAQTAFQEQYQFNAFATVGTLASAALVFLAAKLDPRPSVIFLAVQSPALGARVLNTMWFLAKHKMNIMALQPFDGRIAKSLVNSGLHFSLGGQLTNFLSHVFPIIVVGAVLENHTAAAFAAVMNSIVIAASFFSVTTSPILGVIPDAHAKKETAWINTVYKKTIMLNLIFSFSIFILFSVFGNNIFTIWYHGSIRPSKELLIGAGFYFIVLSLDVTNFMFLSGLGLSNRASLILFARSTIFAILLYLSLRQDSDGLPFLLLASTSLICSTVPLSTMLARRI